MILYLDCLYRSFQHSHPRISTEIDIKTINVDAIRAHTDQHYEQYHPNCESHDLLAFVGCISGQSNFDVSGITPDIYSEVVIWTIARYSNFWSFAARQISDKYSLDRRCRAGSSGRNDSRCCNTFFFYTISVNGSGTRSKSI